jgi:hypothetical protein
VVRLLWAREKLGKRSSTMGEFPQTDRHVAEVCLLIGIEAPKPVQGNPAIQFYKVVHFDWRLRPTAAETFCRALRGRQTQYVVLPANALSTRPPFFWHACCL